MPRRVAITGLGLVSPLGCDVASVWTALCDGQSAIRWLSPTDLPRLATTLNSPLPGALVQECAASDFIDRKSLRSMDRATVFGAVAACRCGTDCGLDFAAIAPGRLGAFVGTHGRGYDPTDFQTAVRACSEDTVLNLAQFGASGQQQVNPTWLLKGLGNGVLFFVTSKYGAIGPNGNFPAGGVSGTVAIGEAARAITRGYLDAAFAGGYDSLFEADRIEMLRAARLLASGTDGVAAEVVDRPFDSRRNGFAPSEGAAFVMLEEMTHARDRGATVYAEVTGYGLNAASGNGLEPSARGFSVALQRALHEAGSVGPDGIVAHGLATVVSDCAEALGIRDALGEAGARVPVTALQAALGNTGAAAGAIDTIIGVQAIAAGCLPAMINLDDPDPRCALTFVTRDVQTNGPLNSIAVNSANLGGAHAALVVQRA